MFKIFINLFLSNPIQSINPIKNDPIQSKNDLLLLHRIREEDTSKWQFFWFAVNSWDTHLSSFFTFSIYFKCQTTIEWSALSSWGTSHVVVRGSATTGHHQWFSQLVVVNFWWSATALIFKALVSSAKCFEPPLHCTFTSSSWPTCIVDVASCLCCFMTHSDLE